MGYIQLDPPCLHADLQRCEDGRAMPVRKAETCVGIDSRK